LREIANQHELIAVDSWKIHSLSGSDDHTFEIIGESGADESIKGDC